MGTADELIWWQCPICNNINSYTQDQLRNRKRCPPCSYSRKKLIVADRRSMASREEFWDVGFKCRTCGKTYYEQMRSGGYPKRCRKCREPKRKV